MNLPTSPDKLDQLITEFREEYGTCMDWIFSELDAPENLGYSQKLMDLFKPYRNVVGEFSPYPIISIIFWFWNGPKFFDKDSQRIKNFEDRMKSKKLALEYLPSSFVEITTPKLHVNNLIYYKDFINCYFWLERIYYIFAGRKLRFEDAMNIYFGGGLEKLVWGLEDFDKLDTIPDPSCEFFQTLSKVRVKKDAGKFKDRTGIILQITMQIAAFKDYKLFKFAENEFIDCLAAFSAANSSRENIIINDYIIAYKTYYKLLKTDLTNYKCQKELFNDEYQGYIVCEDCGSFYELKRGEKSVDFSSCHCGDKVKYVKYLKDGRKINWKSVVIYSVLFSLILTASFKIVNIVYFMIVGIIFLILAISPLSIVDYYDKRGLVLGSSFIIILSFLLSALIIKMYFNDPMDFLTIFIPMCLILALDLIIVVKRKINGYSTII